MFFVVWDPGPWPQCQKHDSFRPHSEFLVSAQGSGAGGASVLWVPLRRCVVAWRGRGGGGFLRARLSFAWRHVQRICSWWDLLLDVHRDVRQDGQSDVQTAGHTEGRAVPLVAVHVGLLRRGCAVGRARAAENHPCFCTYMSSITGPVTRAQATQNTSRSSAGFFAMPVPDMVLWSLCPTWYECQPPSYQSPVPAAPSQPGNTNAHEISSLWYQPSASSRDITM